MFKQLLFVVIAASTMVSAINVNLLAARATTSSTSTTSTTSTSTTTTGTSTSTTSTSASTTTSSGTGTSSTAASTTSSGGSSSSSVSSTASTSTTSASPPTGSGVAIHPNGNTGKCMDVRSNSLVNGTPVQIYDCNGSGAQKWAVQKGQTKVRLAGTNFCLDAGGNPGNGVGMKIWTCYDNLPAQEWYYTGDNRIALFNKGQCLDLSGGRLNNGNQLQTWKCTDYNTNQIWSI